MLTEIRTDTAHYDKCRTMMLTHKRHHLKRAVLVAILMLMNAFISIIRVPITYGTPYLYGFFLGIVIFLYCAVTVVIGFFAVPEKPKLLIITCLLILGGLLDGWIALYFGIPMLMLFLWQIPEAKQAVWLKTQTGYPHFNERFDEQMSHFGKAYQPDHQLDNLRDAEMLDMPETPSPDFVLPNEMLPIPEVMQDISEVLPSDFTKQETAKDISEMLSPDFTKQETAENISEMLSPDFTKQKTAKDISEIFSPDFINHETTQDILNTLAPDWSASVQQDFSQDNSLHTDRIFAKFNNQ